MRLAPAQAARCLLQIASLGLGLFGLGLTSAGCAASTQGEVNAAERAAVARDGSRDPGAASAETLKAAADLAETAALEDTGPSAAALLGARHDLSLKGEPNVNCRCLRVATGNPPNPAFNWDAKMPTIDAETQVVLAISSRDVVCEDAPAGGLGASYEGYTVEGKDVIVGIEQAVEGRPVIEGAILPKPAKGGALYLKPRDSNLPFGRGPKGEPRCQVADTQ